MTKPQPIQKKPDKSHFFVDEIRTSYRNAYLYDACGLDNQDDRDLVDSIRANGIQEPLVLTSDRYLVSGHRRLWAARYLRLEKVPVRFIKENFEELTPPEQLQLLRSFNQQREKERKR